MALTNAHFDAISRELSERHTVTWNRTQLDAAIAAIDSWFESGPGSIASGRSQIGTTIETSAPSAFNAAVKADIALAYFLTKRREAGV